MWLLICLLAQAPPAPMEVSGRVRMDGTLEPVAGAKVALSGLAAGKRVDDSTTTDANGAFRILIREAGRYLLVASADGYATRRTEYGGSMILFDVKAGERRREVDLVLLRPAKLKGRVVDEDTGQPLSGMRVWAMESRWQRGLRSPTPSSDRVTTQADGTFAADGLPPGEYILETMAGEAERITTGQVTEKARHTEPAMGYRRIYWPGGKDIEFTTPFRVAPGPATDLGDIKLRKEPLYRVFGTLRSTGCAAGWHTVTVNQHRAGSHAMRAGGKVPCNSQFTVENLAPGVYELRSFMQADNPAEREYSIVDVEIGKKDVDAELNAARPMRIAGRIVLPEGAPDGLAKKLRVGLNPLGTLSSAGEEPVSVPAKGTFELFSITWKESAVEVWGLPDGYAVKSVTYNGIEAASRLVTPDPAAPAQMLVVTLTDKAAVLSGKVEKDGKSVADALVFIVPWPPLVANNFPARRYPVYGDSEGTFRQGGLQPGKYRAVALSGAGRGRSDEPHVLLGWLERAVEIELGEGAVKSVSLKPVEH